MPKKITTEVFINKAILVHGDRYDYSKTIYRKAIEKVIIICKEHGEFLQTPNRHLTGSGCKKCGDLNTGNKLKSNTKKFIERAIMIHNNRYDYSLTIYDGNKNNLIIICKIHGKFYQIPQNHLKGCGCPKCGVDITSNAKKSNTEEFIEKSIKIHNNKYSYLKSIYIYCTQKVIIICKNHGEFKQRPINHINGQGCSKCVNIQYSKMQIKWLEFLEKLNNIQIQHAMNDGEYKIPTTRYRADGYCKETNTIYEFHGDYWHGNPKRFDPEEENKLCNATHGELYQKTLQKEQKIKDLGYNLVVMWESDWININKSIKTLQNKFRSK